MNRHANALASYGRVANSENDPLEQVVMLYDGCIRFLRQAASDILLIASSPSRSRRR